MYKCYFHLHLKWHQRGQHVIASIYYKIKFICYSFSQLKKIMYSRNSYLYHQHLLVSGLSSKQILYISKDKNHFQMGIRGLEVSYLTHNKIIIANTFQLIMKHNWSTIIKQAPENNKQTNKGCDMSSIIHEVTENSPQLSHPRSPKINILQFQIKVRVKVTPLIEIEPALRFLSNFAYWLF